MSHWHRMAGALIASLLIMGNAMAVEEAQYSVLNAQDPFELRLYEPYVLAETEVSGAFEEAGNEAFGRLFRYISGHNEQQRKVAMTAPVGQESEGESIAMTAPVSQQQQDDRWRVSFMMPASITPDTTPVPKDPLIRIRAVPARHLAAVRYSGFWSEKNYRQNLDRLNAWIKAQGLRITGEPVWARYNAPFVPWFLRRNEILIPVAPPP